MKGHPTTYLIDTPQNCQGLQGSKENSTGQKQGNLKRCYTQEESKGRLSLTAV